MVLFRPLADSRNHLYQCLIKLDANNVNVLVDAGWDLHFSKETLDYLISEIPNIDLILLTHATIAHVGAFCYLRHKYPQFRSIPAFATLPVIRMSQLLTLELYGNVGLCGPYDNSDALSPSEVEQIWAEVTSVKYSQPLKLHSNPKLEGTMITAYNSGHTIGGSLWKIYDGIDSVIVALDWNHARDAHLNGAFLEPKTGTVVPDLQKPSLLITSTHVSSGQPLTKARESFIDDVESALRLQGTVLVPVSCGSRVLELVLILGKHMAQKHRKIPVIYYSRTSKQELTQASSMLEWMVASIIGDWQVQNESPFDANNIHCVSELSMIRKKWHSGPKIILAAGEWMEGGPSREVFLDFVAESANSSVILTELCPPNSLAAVLLSKIKSSNLQQLNFTLPEISIDVKRPLTGTQLEAYLQKKKSEMENAILTVAEERRNQQLIDTDAQAEAASSDSEESDEEYNSSLLKPDTPVFTMEKFDYEVPSTTNVKQSCNMMFPYNAKRRHIDEYGAFIPAGLLSEKKPRKGSVHKHSTDLKVEENSTGDVGDSTDLTKAGPISEKAEEIEQPLTIQKQQRKNVSVVCWLASADMNGLTNLRSLLMVVKQVQPMRIVALPGSDEVCEQLQHQNTTYRTGDKAVEFERTNFSVDVRLDSSLNLKWRSLYGGYSIARVAGTLQFDPHDRIKKFGATLVSSDSAELSSPMTPNRLTIGDLRLTSLRKLLMDAGMKAEFRGQGVLVCNDKVAVQKLKDGSYILQGGIEDDYYKVRRAIRQFMTTI